MSRLFPFVLLAACALPETSDMFHTIELSTPSDAPTANGEFIRLFDNAEETLHVALGATSATDVTDALLEAHERGVEVELVIDGDNADTESILALQEAGVNVALADTGVEFFDFSINADVAWSSDQTLMSHSFAVRDGKRFVTSTKAGALGPGSRLVMRGRGEDLITDILTEHNQLMGGIDATSLTAFSSPAKSVADFRWVYPADSDVNVEMWLGPQERVTKRIIDAVYGAKASVWVLTNDFANEGLSKALQDKAQFGFDVRVVVGPDFGSSNAPLSRVLQNTTPDVVKGRVTDVAHVPTLVLVDYGTSPIDGRSRSHKAFILTHDLYAATRLYRGLEITSDQYIDSALWVMTDYNGLSQEMLDLQAVFDDHQDRSGAL